MNRPALDPRIAGVTGLLYLAMAILGVPGFLIIRPALFDPDSPTATLAQLLEDETLARVGIGIELALVAVQALVALWFYRLFRRVDTFAAGALAAFGLINAVAILASAACLAAALDAAEAPPFADAAGGAQLMYVLSGSFWGVGAIFFGLWLIPMGILALRMQMPRPLGWLVVAGGVGYVLNAFITHLAPAAATVGDTLAYLATVGEFWMIGWLLVYAVRARRNHGVAVDGGMSAAATPSTG